MNKRHIEILKEMIIDFNEYSTDYTKTRCKEIEQVLIDTIEYIDNLQTRWDSLREWLKTDEQKYFTFQPRQNGKTLQAGIKVGLDMVLDKMNELEKSNDDEV